MKKAYFPIVLTAIIVLILLLHINYLRFVCDDAFISFRYAENFVEGHGLVFNVGEKVEGYSNFLWTLLLSLFMKIGLDPVIVSQILGVLFSLATVFLLLRLNRWFYPREDLFNYLAPLFLACCGAYAAWSTGGLETSFFTFLILLGSFFFIKGINQSKHFAYSGITFALVCMTRLDGLILASVSFSFLLYLLVVKKRVEVKSLSLWTLSFLIPFLLYFFWRWSYYGKAFPNTFYIKVAGAAYFQQGFMYLINFVERFWMWFMVIPLLFLGKSMKLNANLRLVVLYFTSMILVFSLYVVYVGGDFMDMFRFFVPILPFLFFLIQEGFRGMYHYPQPFSSKKQRMSLIATEVLLVGLALFVLVSPSRETNQVWHRKDIDSIGLSRENVRLWSKVGLMFKEMAKPGETLSTSAAGAIPYYSGLYTIDELGLTLASLDDLRVRTVQRAGHSKRVTDEFLLSERPTYFVGHPKLYDDFEQSRGVWGFFSEVFLRRGYTPTVYNVRISDSEIKYLYCLTLKAPRSDQTDQKPSTASKPGEDK
ncbi:MAG: hypothetical protein JSV10_04300 [Candidatus Zixiibacteriota bacterium]|nr:MAG: hypothetical protein JSV10_04300 [candidate division Zixibacteria bacterium]